MLNKSTSFYPTHTFTLLLTIWALGFLVFKTYARFIETQPLSPCRHQTFKEGIVVFTGGKDRIHVAVQLFEKSPYKPFLISGLSSRACIQPFLPFPLSPLITLGDQARDTIGNAQETSAWVNENQLNSIQVVTSNYHMARSLMELYSVLPEIKLIPYPVKMDPIPTELLFNEYNKFLYSFFRIVGQGISKGIK